MPGIDDRKFRLQTALEGFEKARQRLMDAMGKPMTGQPRAEDVFIPLSEALWWTVSIDDGFEDLADGSGYRPNAGDYRSARDADPSGQVLQALRYVRNRCGHQRAIAARVVVFGVVRPIPSPVSGGVLRWRPSGELPPADARFMNAALQAEYDRLLAGRFPGEAVDLAAHWFAQEKARAGL